MYGGEAIRVCVTKGEVPVDRQRAIVGPFYKGKRNTSECKNYRGLILLSISWRVYKGIWIERVRYETENIVGEEQC